MNERDEVGGRDGPSDSAAERSGSEQAVVDLLREHDAACPECGYNLRGLRRAVCPECGVSLDVAREAVKSRAAVREAMVAVVAWGVFGALVVVMRALAWPERSVGGVRRGPDAVSVAGVVASGVGACVLCAWVVVPQWWRGLTDRALTRLKWCAWGSAAGVAWETLLRA